MSTSTGTRKTDSRLIRCVGLGLAGALLAVACASEVPGEERDPADAGRGGASAGAANGNGAGGATGGVAGGGSGGSPNATRATHPECFADADALAERVASLKACETKDDCTSKVMAFLSCMRPDLIDQDSPCRGPLVAMARAAPTDEIYEADGALGRCLRPDGYDARFQAVDGRACIPGCAAEPFLACIAGQCEIVSY